ncbi:hypothetical protein ACVWZR_004721 [Bradyrhizobium sp. i1.3.1]
MSRPDDRGVLVDLGQERPQLPPKARNMSPIVPRASIHGRALVAVVAIMTFLASMTTGTVLLVSASAAEWQSDVASEITIQVRPQTGRDLDRDTAAVTEAIRAQAGIIEVKPFTKDESGKLLEPWLGTGLSMDDLPVPRMIIARVQPGTPLDLGALRARVTQAAPSASVDDHRAWIERMRSMTNATVLARHRHPRPRHHRDHHLGLVRDPRRHGGEPTDRRGPAFRRCRRPVHRQPLSASLPQAGPGGRRDRRRRRHAGVRLLRVDRRLVFRDPRRRPVRSPARHLLAAAVGLHRARRAGGADRRHHRGCLAPDAVRDAE